MNAEPLLNSVVAALAAARLEAILIGNAAAALQADFMPVIHGVKSFNSLRSRAEKLQLAGRSLWVASLADIIASKRAAARPRDKAVLDILEKTFREKNPSP